MVQFLLKFLLKLRVLAVYHDFHSLLVGTKFLIAKLHSCYAKGSEIWKGRSRCRSRTFYLGLRNPDNSPLNIERIHADHLRETFTNVASRRKVDIL